MNYANTHHVGIRKSLLSRIEQFNNSKFRTVNEYCNNLQLLMFHIDGYDFQYAQGKIRIMHSWINEKDDDFLLRGINKMMQKDLLYYDIPYLVHFFHDGYDFRVRIVELEVLDARDELVEALLI